MLVYNTRINNVHEVYQHELYQAEKYCKPGNFIANRNSNNHHTSVQMRRKVHSLRESKQN